MNNDTKTTIIIPNYNNVELLSNLLESLDNIKTPYKLIIIDDASSDNSTDFIKNNYPDIMLVENKKNMGFAYSVNQGIKLASTEYVFLLNNDTTVEAEIIDNLENAIEKDENIFSVSSKMIQYHNRELMDDAGDEYNLLGWSKKRGLDKPINIYNDSCEVFSACAGAALYKRDIFNKIGFFDENFGSYVEDMDLSFRARLHGYKSLYEPRAVVYHYGSATSGSKHNPFKVELSARNNVYLIYKNYSLWMKIINFIFITIGILIKYVFFIHKGYGKYYKKGITSGLKNRKTLTKTTNISQTNYLKVELLLIKNTLTYLF